METSFASDVHFSASTRIDGTLSTTSSSKAMSENPVYDEPDYGYNVNDLDIDDVEEFLERVEARRSECEPCGSGAAPPSPFYGRTTPMMFQDDTLSQLPFQQYSSCEAGQSNIQYTSLTLLENANPLQADDTIPPNTFSTNFVVPDFSLLNNCPSPAPSDCADSAVTPPETQDHQDPKFDSKPEDLLADVDQTAINNTGPVTTLAERQYPQDPEPIVTDLIKSELREKINKRRRDSGKEDIVVEWKKYKNDEEEKLTERDIERRRRRRESNRRAAQKSRIKKRHQNETMMQEMDEIKTENQHLKEEVQLLKKELKSLTSSLYEHIRVCPDPGSLSNMLQGNS